MTQFLRQWLSVVLAVVAHGSVVVAADPSSESKVPSLQATVAKGIEYLDLAQAKDGTYSRQFGPGVTALATSALLRHGRTPSDPQVAAGLKFLENCVQADGSITLAKPGTTNYDTSICLACFALANDDKRYEKIIADAKTFLANVQRDEGEGRALSDADYGGVGYTIKTPGGDLSNTHMTIDAFHAAGTGPEDEPLKRAIIFVSRCQNLESEHNTLPFAAKVNDGGFYYSPVGEGYSAAGRIAPGALRSYASMTYAGLQSLLAGGVTLDDPRVQAAIQWLRSHYSVEENVGLGQSGLYYYYYLMAQCLDTLGNDIFKDSVGANHNWRAELAAALMKRQSADGSWINENNRWYEGDRNLATSFALLALAYCRSQTDSKPHAPNRRGEGTFKCVEVASLPVSFFECRVLHEKGTWQEFVD